MIPDARDTNYDRPHAKCTPSLGVLVSGGNHAAPAVSAVLALVHLRPVAVSTDHSLPGQPLPRPRCQSKRSRAAHKPWLPGTQTPARPHSHWARRIHGRATGVGATARGPQTRPNLTMPGIRRPVRGAGAARPIRHCRNPTRGVANW